MNLIILFLLFLSTIIKPTPTIINHIPDQVIKFGESFSLTTQNTFSSSSVFLVSVNSTVLPSWVTIDNERVWKIGQVSSYDTYSARGVCVHENYVYLADHDEGLLVFDITNKAQPTLVGSLVTYMGLDVFVVQDYAFVADATLGVKTQPALIGNLDTDYAYGIFVHENYAYVADYSGGLKIIDVSNKADPILTGSSANYTGIAISVFVYENYAYVADENEGLLIFDVTNKAQPTLVGRFDVTQLFDVFVYENLAYTVVFAEGLKILDVTNKANPTLIKNLWTYRAWKIYVDVIENIAYVANRDGEFTVIDVSNITEPTIIDSIDMFDAYGVAVHDMKIITCEIQVQVRASDYSGDIIDEFMLKVECEDGWSGDICDTRICSPECVNGEECIFGNPTNYCACNTTLWSGDECDIPVCNPECLNEGECVIGDPHTCQCDSTLWSGTACEIPVCDPVCVNGICIHLPDTGQNKCECEEDWIGNDCSTLKMTANTDYTGLIVGIVVPSIFVILVLVLIIFIIVVVVCIRNRKTNERIKELELIANEGENNLDKN